MTGGVCAVRTVDPGPEEGAAEPATELGAGSGISGRAKLSRNTLTHERIDASKP